MSGMGKVIQSVMGDYSKAVDGKAVSAGGQGAPELAPARTPRREEVSLHGYVANKAFEFGKVLEHLLVSGVRGFPFLS